MTTTSTLLRRITEQAGARRTPLLFGLAGLVVVAFVVLVLGPSPITHDDAESAGAWTFAVSTGSTRFARLNTKTGEIDSVVTAKNISDVVQDQSAAWITSGSADGPRSVTRVAPGGASDAGIDAGSASTVTLGPGDAFDAAAGVAAKLSGSTLTIGELDQTGSLTERSVALELGDRRGLVAVGDLGTVVVWDPAGGRQFTVERGAAEARADDAMKADPPQAQFAMIGERPVRLNSSTGALEIEGRAVQLQPDGSMQLQRSGPDTGRVVIAGATSIVVVPTGGGDPVSIADHPAAPSSLRPITDRSCAYAAWEGTADNLLASCGDDPPILGSAPIEAAAAQTAVGFRRGAPVGVLAIPGRSEVWFVKDAEWKSALFPDDRNDDTTVTTIKRQERSFENNRPPTAVPDDGSGTGREALGARPGRTTSLNVLKNDVDDDRDPIVVSEIENPKPGEIELTSDGTVQVTLQPGATGELNFKYRISDGQAQSEFVAAKVQIRQPGDPNSPPTPIGPPPELRLPRGQTASADVVSQFWDPDGDPMFLESVTVAPPEHKVQADSTSGFVTVTTQSDASGAIAAQVRDVPPGRNLGATATATIPLQVTTGAPQVPVTFNDVVVVDEGTAPAAPVQVAANDLNPNGPISELTVTEATERGDRQLNDVRVEGNGISFTAGAGAPDTAVITYTVESQGQTAQGNLLVTIRAAGQSQPRLGDDIVVVPSGRSATVDVLRNDGLTGAGQTLLAVSGIEPPAADPPTPNEPPRPLPSVIANRDLRTMTVEPSIAPAGAYTFRYCATEDDVAACDFTTASPIKPANLTVVVVPSPGINRPVPIPQPRRAVRADSTVVIPIDAIVANPDGTPIEFDAPESSGGQAFVDGRSLRFRAPTTPGVVDVRLSGRLVGLRDPIQNTLSFDVTDAPNRPPAPPALEARVRRGQSVAIPVPLDDADPDHDFTYLTKILPGEPETDDAGGARVDVTKQLIVYEPAKGAEPGLRTVSFEVSDSAGANNAALVSVIVTEPVNRLPQARTDIVYLGAGKTVTIDPAANDTHLQGLTVSMQPGSLKGTDGCSAGEVPVGGGRVGVRISDSSQGCTRSYVAIDPNGGTAPGTIIVIPEQAFKGAPPVLRDDVAELPSERGETLTSVDVLANDVDPDGLIEQARLEPLDPDDGAREESGRLVVELRDAQRFVGYRVTDTDGLTGVAFVLVPKRDSDRPPFLKRGGEIVIPKDRTSVPTVKLSDWIEDPDGDPLTFEQVTNNDFFGAGPLPLTNDEVRLKLDNEYRSGFTRLDVRVRGGESPPVVIAIPVRVEKISNTPPAFNGPLACNSIPQDEGQTGIDITAFDIDPDDVIAYRVTGSSQTVDAVIDDGSRRLSIRSKGDTKVGDSYQVTVEASNPDATEDRTGGQSTAVCSGSFTPTTRPAPSFSASELPLTEGSSATINLADRVQNGCTENASRSIKARSASASPSNLVSASASGSSVTVTATAKGGGPASVTISFEDGCGRPGQGVVPVLVKGRPDPPTSVTAEAVDDGTGGKVTVSWAGAQANGADIIDYQVTASGGGASKGCTTAAQSCTVDATNGVTWSFTVVARNEVGPSAASKASNAVKPDRPPPTPKVSISGTTKGWGITYTCTVEKFEGTPATVTLTAAGLDRSVPVGTGGDCGGTFAAPADSDPITITATAKNEKGDSSATSNSAQPFDAPTVEVSANDTSGTAGDASFTVNWDNNRGANPGASVTVDPAGTCTAAAPGEGTSQVTVSCGPGVAETTITVTVTNAGGTASATATSPVFDPPRNPGSVDVAAGNEEYTVKVTQGDEEFMAVGSCDGLQVADGDQVESTAFTTVTLTIVACSKSGDGIDRGSFTVVPWGTPSTPSVSGNTATWNGTRPSGIDGSFSWQVNGKTAPATDKYTNDDTQSAATVQACFTPSSGNPLCSESVDVDAKATTTTATTTPSEPVPG